MAVDFIALSQDPSTDKLLRDYLQAFDQENGYHTNLAQYGWHQIWRELVNISIYHRGCDVAEVGSTWVQSLLSMNSLRAFSSQELRIMGGRENFFPALWQNISLGNDQKIWGIPFRADVRTLYYWEDMLLEAGIEDPENAFLTFDLMQATLEKLQKHYPEPWVIHTDVGHSSMHQIASWIRGAGGDLMRSEGKQTLFTLPESIQGIQAYFELCRFLPRQGHPFGESAAIEHFGNRRAAVVMGGPWMMNHLRTMQPDDMVRRVKIALPPGPPFVGGTVLVLWNHNRDLSTAIELIRALFMNPFYSRFCMATGHIPVQVNFADEEYMRLNHNLPMLQKAISVGRGLEHHPLWGMVEERMIKAFGLAWQDIYSTPSLPTSAEIARIIDDRIIGTARRVNLTLAD